MTSTIVRDTEEEHAGLEVVTNTFLRQMRRDLLLATATLSDREARYLVDSYYQMQDNRKRSEQQYGKLREHEEPAGVLPWLINVDARLESAIRSALGGYAERSTVGQWSLGIPGIGPVLAAGLLAHCGEHIAQIPTVGHIWRFAGLDPSVRWGKKEKRPWNARLKVLTWKIGESFVKVSTKPGDIYGHVYAARKAEEAARNEQRAFQEQAEHVLASKQIGKDTEAYRWYSQGKLPPAHIHARAKRYAVKLFLSHWHHIAYEVATGTPPPKPYILNQPGHVHFIAPPNWPPA